jgi:hypothetical protein
MRRLVVFLVALVPLLALAPVAADAVTAWVEHGTAPDTLPATVPGTNTTRDLCRYPLTSHYTGGDPANPAAYRCTHA